MSVLFAKAYLYKFQEVEYLQSRWH